MIETTKSKRNPDVGMTALSLSPLAHPAWWAALAVLVVNDHLLKGAGLLPNFVTGKLSDLAGLVVAPVLLAALLGARRTLARAAAFAVVAVGFAAVKLSPSAAALVAHALGAVGVPSRIWADPTDLVALAVLPLAWRIASTPRRISGPTVVSRAGVVVGAIACVATSRQPPLIEGTWLTDAFAVNQTGDPIDLRISWARGELDCASIEGRASRVFGPDTFDEGITFTVDDGHTIPFERAAAQSALGEGDGTPTDPRPCDAVLLQADGLPDTVVFWTGLPLLNVDPVDDGATSGQSGRVEISSDGDGLAVTATGVEVGAAIERTAPSGCENDPQVAYQFSIPDLDFETTWTLDAFEVGADGCLLLDFSDTFGGNHLGFLCVPATEFPFHPGDALVVAHSAESGLTMRRDATDTVLGAQLDVWSAVSSIDSPPGTVVAIDWCDGDRLDCDGYVMPGALQIEGSLVRPGERMELPADARGWPGRLLVGRAEHVVLALPECDVDQTTVSTYADVLVVHEQEVL